MTNEEYINELIEIGNVLQIHPNSPKGKALKKAIELLKSDSFPEREKGEWVRMGEAYVCSRCSTTCACTEMADRWVWHTDDKFCRGCGADMRGKDEREKGTYETLVYNANGHFYGVMGGDAIMDRMRGKDNEDSN